MQPAPVSLKDVGGPNQTPATVQHDNKSIMTSAACSGFEPLA